MWKASTPSYKHSKACPFSSYSAHVVCLQETHFSPSRQRPNILLHKFTLLQHLLGKGAIWLHSTILLPSLSWQKSETQKVATLDSEVTVVSYYTPNKNHLPFLSHLLTVINSHKREMFSLSGDSNRTIYPFSGNPGPEYPISSFLLTTTKPTLSTWLLERAEPS